MIGQTKQVFRLTVNKTKFILERRESISKLAAVTIEEKLDRMADLATAIAIQLDIQSFIREENWIEATRRLQEIPKYFPFIDRIFLADSSGNLKGNIPYHANFIGLNYSSREWFPKILSKRQTFISNVHRRTVPPHLNVIDIAHPIEDTNHHLLGIIIFQIPLRNLFDWTKEVSVGHSGFIYLVDRVGNLVSHPRFSFHDQVVSFSTVPVVQKVIGGEQGVSILYNPIEKEERIVAYTPVEKYGWGVIAQQPTRAA